MVSIMILYLSAFIGYLIPDIVQLFSVIGGTSATLLGVTIPSLCYYKLNGLYRKPMLVICMIMTVIGITTSFVSLL